MPRASKIQPTYIYWLYDIRPQTLIEHQNGRPFYCGKTVLDLNARLRAHRVSARKNPDRPVSQVLNDCGNHLRIEVVAVAPAHEIWTEQERAWIALEKFWIESLRSLWSGTVNVSEGGAGAAGCIRSAETRAMMGESNRRRTGIKFSDTARANMSAARTGRKRAPFTEEHRANLRIGSKNRSAEDIAKINAGRKGRKLSDEHRAKISTIQKGRKRKPWSAEIRAKISMAKKGRPGQPHSPETRAKMRAAHLARSREVIA